MKSLFPAVTLTLTITSATLAPTASAAPTQRLAPSAPQVVADQVIKPSSSRSQGFFAVPTLDSFSTTSDISYNSATYEVKLTVPANAGRALQAVRIKQEPNFERVDFTASEIKAVLPNGKTTPIEPVQPAKTDGDATVVFNPPLKPGQIVTIELPVHSNPNDGIYLFGVTAIPTGNTVRNQFLGFGRLHIYNR